MAGHAKDDARTGYARGSPSRLRAGLILACGQVVSRAAIAIYSLVLIHRLTRTGYGDFAFAISLVSILVLVADGGFTRVLIRDLARRPDHADNLMTELLVVRTAVVAAIVALAAGAGILGALPLHGWLLVAFLAALGIQALALGFESAAVGTERAGRMATGQNIEGANVLVCLVLVASIGATPALAVGGLAVAAAAKLVFHIAAWRHVLSLPSDGRSQSAGTLFQAAWPYLILAALGTVYYKIDIVILHTLRGSGETAPYAAAYRIVDASLVVGAVVLATVSPHLSRLQETSPALVWPTWRRYTLCTAALVAAPVIATSLAAKPIAGVLFGERYSVSAGESLALLAPGIAFMLLHTINAAVLLADDDHSLTIMAAAASAAVNIALTLWLVHVGGARGAALATTVSEVLLFSTFALWIRARYGGSLPGAGQPT